MFFSETYRKNFLMPFTKFPFGKWRQKNCEIKLSRQIFMNMRLILRILRIFFPSDTEQLYYVLRNFSILFNPSVIFFNEVAYESLT